MVSVDLHEWLQKVHFMATLIWPFQLQSETRDGCAERRGGFQNFLTNDDIITSNNTRKEGKAITKISSPPPMHFIVFA